MRVFLAIFLSLKLCACASPDRNVKFGSEPDQPGNAKVHPAAYSADWFTLRKPMKVRPVSEIEFYFKDCTASIDRGFYSKTEYFCEYP